MGAKFPPRGSDRARAPSDFSVEPLDGAIYVQENVRYAFGID